MKLDDWLAARHMSAAEFADKLKVNRTTVGRWLGPEPDMRPGWDLLNTIVKITGGQVTANDFLPTPLPSTPATSPTTAEATP
jgi:transcriptional regulator with XRE-family HTH domain